MARSSFVSTVGFTPTCYGAFISTVRLARIGDATRVRSYRASEASATRMARIVDALRWDEKSAIVPGRHGWIFVRWPDLAPGECP